MTIQQIVQNLIASAPIRLKADPPQRQETNGPTFTTVMIGCLDCQRDMKSGWLRLVFVERKEEEWQSHAQSQLDQHLKQFHES